MASRMSQLEGELERRRRTGTDRAETLEGDVDRRRSEFDPAETARGVAQAGIEDFREQFGEDLQDIRGANVGMGRLRTGFGGMDERHQFERQSDQLRRDMLRSGFTAASMDLQNIGGIQAAGEGARTGADAALAGQLDRADIDRERKREKRRGRLGLLGAGIGAVGGFFAGGPAGASIGARIGGGLANV